MYKVVFMSEIKYSNVKISGISVVMPNNKHISNNSDCNSFYTSPKGVTNVDMCEAALNDLISHLNIDINKLDAVIFVNQYPDYLSPSSSHVIHKRLGLPVSCSVFDIYHGGSGYIYGLLVAGSMLSMRKYKNIILLAGEDINSENTNFNAGYCLSSAGSATLLEYDETVDDIYFLFGTDSSKYEDIIIPAGAYRLPLTHKILNESICDSLGNSWSLKHKYVNIESFKEFLYDNIPSAFNNILKFSNNTVENIDFFAINQFNKNMVNSLAEKLCIPADKYSSDTFIKYGYHTVISSIINAVDVLGDKINGTNNKLCFITFGEGLSYALSIININKIYCSGINIMDFNDCIMAEEYHKYWIEKLQNGQ